MHKLTTLIVILAVYAYTIYAFGRLQSVSVKGRLMCHRKPAANVTVQLEDYDTASKNDIIDTGKTGHTGHFALHGSHEELTAIDPQIRIIHHCHQLTTPCNRTWVITVPDMYIHRGNITNSTFDLGQVNLEVILQNEHEKCLGL